MKGLDLRQFKKISSDDKSTTLAHPKGHQITIAHAGISKDMRKQLDELPIHKDEGGKVDPIANGSAQAHYGKDPRQQNNEGHKEAEKGAQESGTMSLKQAYNNVKEGLGLAKGGMVDCYADGGEVADNSGSDEQPQQPAHAPVTINIGTNPSQPLPMPAGAINPNPGSQAMAQNPPIGQAQQDPGELPYGVPPAASNAAAANSNANALPSAGASIAPQESQNMPSQGISSDPYGTAASQDVYMKGLEQQRAGIIGQANAMGQQGQAQAAALHQAVQNQQQNIQSYQDHFNTLDQERQAAIEDYKNQHIDPDHYFSNLGTGRKIGTAIGLILGGLGAGASNGPNLAAEFLNRNIQNDIEAQKAELGKRQNLLSANLQQFHNIRDAADMTRVMMNDLVSHQLQEAAAKATSPLAKAQALQQIGQLNQQSAGMVGQMAMRRTLLSGMQAGRVSPDKVVNLLVPESQRAAANKELTDAQNTVAVKDNLLNAFDQLAEKNTIAHRLGSPIQSSKEVSALRDPLLASLSKDTAGRFTEADAGMLKPLFPAPGDSEEVLATKRNQMNKLISEKMHFPILSTYGIDANKLGRFGGQGQSRITESAPVR